MTERPGSGFTLIEITISMVILAVGLLGLLTLFPVGFDASKRANDLTLATIYAESLVNELKAVGFDNIDTYVVDNATYDENSPDINTRPDRGWCITGDITNANNPEKLQSNFEYYIDKSGVVVNGIYRPVVVTVFWPAENNNNFAGHDFTKMQRFDITINLVK